MKDTLEKIPFHYFPASHLGLTGAWRMWDVPKRQETGRWGLPAKHPAEAGVQAGTPWVAFEKYGVDGPHSPPGVQGTRALGEVLHQAGGQRC